MRVGDTITVRQPDGSKPDGRVIGRWHDGLGYVVRVLFQRNGCEWQAVYVESLLVR